MKILIIFDKSGPKYHRLLLPCFYMPGVELVSTHQITEELCKDIDVLYFNRLIPGCSINQVLAWRSQYGFKIVADFDDHWKLSPDHYLYETYERTQASDFMEAWIYEADAVTVTHERLASDVMPLNPNVHVLPNAIPKEAQFLTKKQPSDITRLFWAGGVTHEKDIELLRGPVKRMKGLPVKMVMGGYTKNTAYQRMASAFTLGGSMNHELLEALPVADYYHMYSMCDIALIPLTETRFNSYKSNLKILEAANIGANVIVSNVHPYKDLPYVNYVDVSSDWYKWVSWILKNKEEAKEQAMSLQKYCDERFNFTRINKTRYNILCDLITEQHLKNTGASMTHG